MGTLRDEQLDALHQLEAAGIDATDDPAKANTNRPCVLVGPPTLELATRSVVHNLVALSSAAAGTLDALEQLDELVTAVCDALPVETANPVVYALTPATDPVPAYVMRVTGTY